MMDVDPPESQMPGDGAGDTNGELDEIRQVLVNQVKDFLDEAQRQNVTEEDGSGNLSSIQALLLKGQRFVECLGICLADSVSAFGWSIESNRTLSMMEAGYSEEALSDFYKYIHAAASVIFLNPKLVGLQGTLRGCMENLYNIFSIHHPHLLEWAIQDFVSLGSRLLIGVFGDADGSKEEVVVIDFEPGQEEPYSVSFDLSSPNLYNCFLSLVRIVCPHWKLFNGPNQESKFLGLYLGTLKLGARIGGPLDRLLDAWHPKILPKTYKGLDLFGQIFCTVIRISLAGNLESSSLYNWFQRNWKLQQNDQGSDVTRGTMELSQNKWNSFQAYLGKYFLKLVLFNKGNGMFNDSLGTWIVQFTLSKFPDLHRCISSTPLSISIGDLKNNSMSVGAGLFSQSTLWLPILAEKIFAEFKADSQPSVFMNSRGRLRGSSSSPTWNSILLTWNSSALSVLKDLPSGSGSEKLLWLLTFTNSMIILSKKFLEYLATSQAYVEYSSIYTPTFWKNLTHLIRIAQSPVYTSKIWVHKLLVNKMILIANGLGSLDEYSIPIALTKSLLIWISPWTPRCNKSQKEQDVLEFLVNSDMELVLRCTQTLSSPIFKSDSSLIPLLERIFKTGLLSENPGFLIGFFNLIGNADPVICWGLCRVPEDKVQVLDFIENYIKTKVDLYQNNFRLHLSLAAAVSRLPCALVHPGDSPGRHGPCAYCDDHQEPPSDPVFKAVSKYVVQATFRLLLMLTLQSSGKIHPVLVESLIRFQTHVGPDSGHPSPTWLVFGRSENLTARRAFLTSFMSCLKLQSTSEDTQEVDPRTIQLVSLAFLQLKSSLNASTSTDELGPALKVYHILDSLESISLMKSKVLSDQIITTIIWLLCVQTNSGVSSRGKKLMTNIARSVGLGLRDWVGMNREEISELIIQVLLSYFCGSSSSASGPQITHVMGNIEVCLGLKHTDFKRIYLPVILQILLVRALTDSIGATTLLESFVPYEGSTNLREMLELNFSTYFTNLVLAKSKCAQIQPGRGSGSHSKININRVLQYLKTKGVAPELIASISMQTLLNELLSHLSTDGPTILTYLNSLILWQKGRVHKVPVRSDLAKEEVIEFLTPRLMGFYIWIHKLMDSASERIPRKTSVFESFIQLLELVGPTGVTATKARIVTLLNSVMKYSWVRPYLIKAWTVYSMNLDDSAIVGAMSDVIPIILNLHQTLGIPIGSEFDELCLYFTRDKGAIDPTGVQDIFYVEYYTQNPQLLQILAHSKRKGMEHFYFIINAIQSSNTHVQYQALLAMRRVLIEQDSSSAGIQLKELIEDSNLIHHKITQLVLALLHGSRSQNPQVSIESLKIIGELGALDYYRLKESHDSSLRPSFQTPQQYFIPTEAFALNYLRAMIRSATYSAPSAGRESSSSGLPSSKNYDIIGFALQETLKEWGITESTATNSHPIWKHLNSEEQNVLRPFLTSKYQKNKEVKLLSLSSIPNQILGSSLGKCHKGWVETFSQLLFHFLSSGPVKEWFGLNLHVIGQGGDLWEGGISEFLLTTLILYAAMNGTINEQKLICEELTSVCKSLLKSELRKAQQGPLLDNLPPGSRPRDTEDGLNSEDPLVSSSFTTSSDSVHIGETQSISLVFRVVDMTYLLGRMAGRDFDRLNKIARGVGENYSDSSPSSRGASGGTPTPTPSIGYPPLKPTFVRDIYNINPDPRFLAHAAVQIESYHRALWIIEEFLRYFPERLEENFSLLQRIYVALEDIDSVLGISSKRRRKSTIFEDTLDLLVAGKKESALSNFDVIIQKHFNEFISEEALIQSYLAIAPPEMSLTILDGIMSRRGPGVVHTKARYSSLLQECRIEACVKLGKWEEVQGVLKNTTAGIGAISVSWTIAHATALMQFQQAKYSEALQTIEQTRSNLILSNLSKCSNTFGCSADSSLLSIETYQQLYGDISRLHILAEMEQAIHFMDKSLPSAYSSEEAKTQLVALLSDWEIRLSHVQKSVKIYEPLLSNQRALLSLMMKKINKTPNPPRELTGLLMGPIRETSLRMAKLELKDRNFSRAQSHIHVARRHCSPSVYIQEAKFLALRGNIKSGISLLQDCLSRYFPQSKIQGWIQNAASGSSEPETEQILCSKVLLLLARFNDQQCLVDIDENIQNYKKAAQVNQKCENNFFSLASYYYAALTTHQHLQQNKTKKREYEVNIVKNYCRSLQYGSKHIYQSLPRLLTTWFDYGTEQQQSGTGSGKNSKAPSSGIGTQRQVSEADQVQDGLKIMTKAIDSLLHSVPEYVFFTCFSQLISRICHSNPLIWFQLKSILIRLILTHPHQALWNLMAVLKSTYPTRKQRCEEILIGAKEKSRKIGLYIRDYPILATNFIELANAKTSPNTRFIEIKAIAPKIVGLFNSSTNFSKILLPFNEFMTVNISRNGIHSKDHKPFSTDPVYLTIGKQGSNRIEVMTSLVRPKKIPVFGSNGKLYHILVKPADDLRKDSKVMELGHIVNWYLGKNHEARERGLHVNTYAVVPLNEETGLLEWIPNLQGIRVIMSRLYRDKKLGIASRELKALYPNKAMSLETKRRVFVEEILTKYPPVLWEWFLDSFSDPREWYIGRRNYVRTAGVMSILGFVIGLGDRHGENILIQSTNGEIVHVDFNCIFNKGESLDVPERVPFRLTRNLVDAMGPLGWDGPFRSVCEITLGIFRENSQVFLSILEAFVYDPLVEWARIKSTNTNNQPATGAGGILSLSTRTSSSGELSNQRAKDNLTAIATRLDGRARNMTKELNVPLSVDAQVNYLIREASSVDNLCQMYVGWGAYL